MFDATAVRGRFPSLQMEQDGKLVLFFDNPAGTQVPRETIDGFTTYLTSQNANEGGAFRTSRATDHLIGEARRAMADFLGASSAEEIVFGQNMTSLTFHLSHSLTRMLQPGDEIVTTRLEHDANIAPWLALQDRGILIRWIDIHPEDVTLDLASAAEVITDRTRLVAVGLASNAFGTVNDVRRVADMAHAVGAWVFVDAVHYGPHGPIDVTSLGADLLACSSYKFFGPHLGVLYGRYEVLSTIPSHHVRPSGDDPPDSWETGTQSHESLSALLGTLSYLESLAPEPSGSRRERLQGAMGRINAYERTLSERLIAGLQRLPGVRIYGITDPSRFAWRVPTLSFTVDGRAPDEVAARLGERGIFSWSGNHYALEPMGRLGLEGTQRIGLVHYNTPAEIDRFLQTVEEIIAVGVPA
jgi:cysteine desulfurase family protein (TIGR01976 family)